MKNAGIFSVVVIGLFGLVAGLVTLNGIMLSYMWQWFVVPLGVRSIHVPQAIGIAIIVAMLTREGVPDGGKESEPFKKFLALLVARVVAFAVAFGLSFMVPA